jgi:cobalt-zinc-cadmium efflux system outer membrane protein
MLSVSRWRRTLTVAVGTWLLAAGAVLGQQPPTAPPGDPVLQMLIDEALARHPGVQAAHSAISAAETRVEQARAYPNPMVSTTFTNDGWAPSLGSMPMTTLGVMVSQELPYSRKRDLRAALATAEARQLEPSVTRVRLSLEASVKRAYYALLLARELQALTDEQRNVWKQVESVVRLRYAIGQGAQPDVLRTQTELARVEQRAIEQATEVRVRLAELNQLRARPLDTPIVTSSRLSLLPLEGNAEEAATRAVAMSPELEGVRRAIDTDRAALDVARRAFKPDFSVQGGYMNRGGLDPMWVAGFGVSWPISKKARESAVAEAEIRAHGDGHEQEALALRLAYQTQERFMRAQSAEQLIALYDRSVIVQDELTLQSTIANYQTNKVPFVSILESVTTLYADRWARTTLLADHARIRVSIDEAALEQAAEMTGPATVPARSARRGGSGSMGSSMSGR